MLTTFRRELVISLRALAFFSILLGVLYPLLVTGISQLAFSRQANGSLVYRDGKPIASTLVGQPFTSPRYFWGRPSAISAVDPDPDPKAGPSALPAPIASSGSNLGPSNPDLHKAIAERIAVLRAADPGNLRPIPIDLVTASASGLDPHISPAAARYQLARVARARGMTQVELDALVDAHIESRLFGLFGEPIVDVVRLNIALDERDHRP